MTVVPLISFAIALFFALAPLLCAALLYGDAKGLRPSRYSLR